MHGLVMRLCAGRGVRLVLILFAFLLSVVFLGVVLYSADAAAPPAVAVIADGAPEVFTPTLNCRLGYATVRGTPAGYPLTLLQQLNADHYLNWVTRLAPDRPLGMEFIQIIRIHQLKECPQWDCPYVVPYTYTVYPDRATIVQTAAANPGSLWLIGNEIDRRDFPGANGQTYGQDEMLPELYAVAYHELQATIKSGDATARVANSGVIQGTPLRLEYLDRMWDEYVRLYGQPMPVDEWNVHGFVFREKRFYLGCPDCWGADVPPGIDVPWGRLYEPGDSISITLFIEQLEAFREWMWQKGQGDKPLIVSEYGIFPVDWYEPGAGAQYVYTGTFDYLRNATHPVYGFAADERRLVQRWVFYSLDDDSEYGGAHVIDPTTNQLTEFGQAWVDYVNDPAHGFKDYRPDLQPVGLVADPAVPYSPDGSPVDVMLYPQVSNSGDVSTTVAFTVTLVDSQWPLGGVAHVGTVLPGCGRRVLGTDVQLFDLLPGVHTVTLHVDPDQRVAETDEGNNIAQLRLLVASHRVYFPVAAMNWRSTIP